MKQIYLVQKFTNLKATLKICDTRPAVGTRSEQSRKWTVNTFSLVHTYL